MAHNQGADRSGSEDLDENFCIAGELLRFCSDEHANGFVQLFQPVGFIYKQKPVSDKRIQAFVYTFSTAPVR